MTQENPVCIAIDFETSGRYGYYACAIGMARLENGQITDQYFRLIRPPSSNVWFTHIHGLRWNDLKNEQPFPQLWASISQFMAGCDYLVAHNARFDRGVLYACCEKFGLPVPGQKFLDTLKGSRAALKLSSHSLSNICAYFKFDLDHHNAASDALNCARIYLELVNLGVSPDSMILGGN